VVPIFVVGVVFSAELLVRQPPARLTYSYAYVCALPLTPILHYLFTLCLYQHRLPCEWKCHKIIPIFKNKDKSRVNNYRPISLLSVISKVFERLIVDKIKAFIYEKINPCQFGFMPQHSALQQMLLFIDSIGMKDMPLRLST